MEKIMNGEKIVKTFGEGEEKHTVLNDVSIQIYEGEFVAVMGPSGSGKSTLMYALSYMDTFDSGKVIFDKRDLSKLNQNELADMRLTKMGFVFQQPTFLKNLNLLDNIILPAMKGNKKDSAKILERARSLMEKAGIKTLERREITQVSGGQLQRAGICRAFMSNPKIIFGDEPTGALNSKAAEEIMEMFEEINEQGTAIMLVTHDAKVAARAERIMFMRDGKIVSELRLPKAHVIDLEKRMEKINQEMQTIGI